MKGSRRNIKRKEVKMKGSRRNIIIVLVVFASLVFILSRPHAVAAEKEFRIGLAWAFSGFAAPWGIACANGVRMAGDEFNAKGGLNIGGERYIIKYYEADTKGTPEGAAVAARRLVEADKVHFVTGAVFTQTSKAVQTVTEAFIFLTRTYPNKRPFKVTLLSQNYESSWFGHGLVKKIAKHLPIKIVYEEFYDEGTKDFYPFLIKLVASNPDVYYNTSDAPPEWALRQKQARELGYKGMFMENCPTDLEVMMPIAGKEALELTKGIAYLTEGPMTAEGTKKYKQAYIKKFGHWDPASLWAAPTASAILHAYEAAGTLNTDRVAEVLESGRRWENVTGIPGFVGGTEAYGHPHQWLADQYVTEVRNGKVAPLGKISIDDMLKGYKMIGD